MIWMFMRVKNMSNIFASTFPNYNYSVIKNAEDIEKGISAFAKPSEQDLDNMIINYNTKFLFINLSILSP